MVAEPGRLLKEMETLMVKVRGEIEMASSVTKSAEMYSMVKQLGDALMYAGIIMTRQQEEVLENKKAITQQNAAIVAAISNNTGTGNANRQFSRPISEHKAIQYLKVFESDKLQFVNWNDKLINALGQVHVGSNESIKRMNRKWAQASEEITDVFELEEIFKDCFVNVPDLTVDKFQADMHYVLVEKTSGEAANKVKAVDAGQGLMAYYRIYWWFTKTSGTALQDQSRKVLYPQAVNKDEKIMEAIEEWENSVKILQQHGAAYNISSLAKLNALEVLMGNKSAVYESIERTITTSNPDDKYTAMMSKLREYAAKKRWDHQHKKGNGDAMDIGELQKELEELKKANENWEIDAIGKGKKGFKGAGKNNYKQVCYNCYEEGHIASKCSKPPLCGNCLKPGHYRAQCTNQMHFKVRQRMQSKAKAKGKGKGINEITEEEEWFLGMGEEEGDEGEKEKECNEIIRAPPGLGKGGGYVIPRRMQEECNISNNTDDPPTLWDSDDEDEGPINMSKEFNKGCCRGKQPCSHGLKGKWLTMEEVEKKEATNEGIEIETWEMPKKFKNANREILNMDKGEMTINEIDVRGNWERVPVKLDSGAIDWVITPGTANAFPLEATPSSKAGVNYVAANGTDIHNYGQRKINGYSNEKVPLNVAAQVADVRNNLGSAYRMCQAGNRVILDEDGSYIENKKTGKRIKVKMEKGAFEFDLWVKKVKEMKKGEPIKVKTKVNNKFDALMNNNDEDEDEDVQMLDMVFRRQEM